MRLTAFREVIARTRRLLQSMRLTEKAKDEDKIELLGELRNALPDSALSWLDAAYVLGSRDQFGDLNELVFLRSPRDRRQRGQPGLLIDIHAGARGRRDRIRIPAVCWRCPLRQSRGRTWSQCDGAVCAWARWGLQPRRRFLGSVCSDEFVGNCVDLRRCRDLGQRPERSKRSPRSGH